MMLAACTRDNYNNKIINIIVPCRACPLERFSAAPGTLHTHAYTHTRIRSTDGLALIRAGAFDTSIRTSPRHLLHRFPCAGGTTFSPLGPTSVGKDGLEVLQDDVWPERWGIGRV